MTYEWLFSKKYNLRPTPEGLVYTVVPERARIGLYQIIEQSFGDNLQKSYSDFYKEICVGLRIARHRISNEFACSIAIEELVKNCDWYQFYDICQIAWANPSQYTVREHQERITERINRLFKEEQLGYELVAGQIEKVGSAFIDAKVKEARYLLKEPEFKGADAHFGKAMKALNERPNPDVENCIKDSVAAIESVGRVIVGDEKAMLDDIIKNAVQKNVIPKPLDQTIIKLYAYRGNEPGVAHGAVDISKVTEAEADLILGMSAAMIIYLVKKRSLLS